MPNIKFNAAKVLEKLVALVDASAVDQAIKPCLVELSMDADGDVRFFAQHALLACSQGRTA